MRQVPPRIALSASLLGCSLVWLLISRGRHVGWIGFLSVAVLCWMG